MKSSRRQFGQQVLATASALAASVSIPLSRQSEAAESAANPRFLINIHTRGGRDTYWWQNYCRKNDFESYLNRTPSDTRRIEEIYTDRFNPNLAVAHPFEPRHTMGIGMSLFSRDDWSRMSLIKGATADGGHEIGNRIINCGLFSPYSTSFSSLIAAELARRTAPLPLQFVQISKKPEDLFSIPGLMSGYAVGVNLADISSFQRLTEFLPNEFPEARRAMMSKYINKLGEQASAAKFRLTQSKSFIEVFMNSFKALGTIYGSNLAQSAQFNNTLSAYKDAATAAVSELNGRYNLTASSLGAPATLPPDRLVASVPVSKVDSIAFSFAMAEFLITQGLTRVIDIGPLDANFDGHAENDIDFSLSLMVFSMFRALMRRLKVIQCPGTQSKSYLDQTTIVLSTEFDRTPLLSFGLTGRPYGTNHGTTSSFLIAGAGVVGGKVIGDFKTAPGSSGAFSAFSSIPAFDPLPVDAQGNPSPNGTFMTTKCIFPTVLSLFGVAVPSQQQTEGYALSPIIAG